MQRISAEPGRNQPSEVHPRSWRNTVQESHAGAPGPMPVWSEIRDASAFDIPAIAEMHERLLQASLLAQLGRPFLNAFHKAAASHPQSFAFAAFGEARRLAGFTLATSNAHGFSRHVRPLILPALVRALLTRERIGLLPKFVQSLVEKEPAPVIPGELLLLFVDPTYQRQRLGSELLGRVEERLLADGVHQYRVAVRSQLLAARVFYESVGFLSEQQLTVLGEPMTYLVRRCSESSPSRPRNGL